MDGLPFHTGILKKMKLGEKRYIPAILILLISAVTLLPAAFTLPQHGDEAMYVWKAAYYGNRLLHLQFDFDRADDYSDPGFSPFSFWAMEQPFGSHLIFAAAMKISGTSGPSIPFKYLDPKFDETKNLIPASTLPVVRLAAVLCASVGLALIVSRWGWPALFACVLFLAIPHVRPDLSRAWAEGPLLLGFGLCAVLIDTKYLGVALGLTASFKLTGILLWPVAGYVARKLPRRQILRRTLSCLLTWSVVNPLSWFAGGPFYILVLLSFRAGSFFWQTRNLPIELKTGSFFPTRYFWPAELALLLLVFVWALPACLHSLRSRRRRSIESHFGEHPGSSQR